MAHVNSSSESSRKRRKIDKTNKNESISLSAMEEMKNAMYSSCASHEQTQTFSQEQLLALNIIPNRDVTLLQQCAETLSKEGLFKVMTKNGRLCWRVVKKADAARYKSMTVDEALVFSYIDTAGSEGIKLQAIRHRSGLHAGVVTKSLKSLEKGKYIKQVATLHAAKTYMRYDLHPPESVAGGPFYDKKNQEMDVDFIQILADYVERYIVGRSWYFPDGSRSLKRKEKDPYSTGNRDRSSEMLPMPPGHTGYPTIASITKDLNSSGLSNAIMKEAEMQQIVDILCWDGKIEKSPFGEGYKALRNPQRTESQHGLTEAPCGRCPNLAICHDDGPVNIRSCTYFQEWLAPVPVT